MAGIAGISGPGKGTVVEEMLEKISHRGKAGRKTVETDSGSIGVVWTPSRGGKAVSALQEKLAARDTAGRERFAEGKIDGDQITLKRDPLGVAPLYYGHTDEGELCFASEVKALTPLTNEVHELPAGHAYDGETLNTQFQLKKPPLLQESPENIAKELNKRISASVENRIVGDEIGSWLSGGLDSSTLAALARPHVERLHTFAAGVEGAPDLDHAQEVARFIDSIHHEAIFRLEDMLEALPEVIYHLESFDALLVRSSISNYLVSKLASDYVSEVFSGESGDELFAGYEYLKSLDPDSLADELIDITARLHNTAFQRVDRSSTAHGTLAHVAFSDPDVVDYALSIPPEYKLHEGIEKWILRRAMDGALPERVLNRTKAKFWEGAGVVELLAHHAEETISDADFERERTLPNGWEIHTKEELMYCRIFKEVLGISENLDWMGRTKGAPVN